MGKSERISRLRKCKSYLDKAIQKLQIILMPVFFALASSKTTLSLYYNYFIFILSTLSQFSSIISFMNL